VDIEGRAVIAGAFLANESRGSDNNSGL
jgi:hypothetical protein